MAVVHQILPTLSPRDAVGNYTLELHRLLGDLGHDSNLWAANIHHELTDIAQPLGDLPDDDEWCIYHHSIGGVAGDFYEQRAGKRVLVYHNITPIEQLERWSAEIGAEITLGREQLSRYAKVTDLAVCDSDFNRSEVDAAGYSESMTIPVMFEPGRLMPRTRTRRTKSDPKGSGLRLLFVGRIAPNKAQHDLVAMFAVLCREHDPNAELHLVGSKTFSSYFDAVGDYVDALGLDGVHIYDGVTDQELADHYGSADVFVCASEHEGFCVPIVEAMHHLVPVVAYASTAVTGTVGGAGLILPDKSADVFAAAVARVGNDQTLANSMREAGQRQAAEFTLTKTRAAWSTLIAALLDGA